MTGLPGQPINGPGEPVPGPGLPGQPINPPSVEGLTPEQVTQLLSMPRTTPEEMSTYVNALKELADQISTGVMVSSGGNIFEADIFSPHTLLSHFNGNHNPVLKKLIDSGILDINKDGKTDSLDYYSLMKGSLRENSPSDFEGIINAPQVNEETANNYKAMPRATSEDIASYIEKMHKDYLNLSLYGGVQVNDLGQDESRYLQDIISGNNRSGNPRAQEAFAAGIYDFNKDGVTDAKDVEIMNRFVSGNKNFDDLLTPIDQQPVAPIAPPVDPNAPLTKATAVNLIDQTLNILNIDQVADILPRTVIPTADQAKLMKDVFDSAEGLVNTIHLSPIAYYERNGAILPPGAWLPQVQTPVDYVSEDKLKFIAENIGDLQETFGNDPRYDKFFDFVKTKLEKAKVSLKHDPNTRIGEDPFRGFGDVFAGQNRTPNEIREFVQIFNPILDVTGDGTTNSFTDLHKLIGAYTSGVRDPQFYEDNKGPNANKTGLEIRDYIQTIVEAGITDISGDGFTNYNDFLLTTLGRIPGIPDEALKAFSTSPRTGDSLANYLARFGDLNNDQGIDKADVHRLAGMLFQKFQWLNILGPIDPNANLDQAQSREDENYHDFNNDGKTDVQDLRALLKYSDGVRGDALGQETAATMQSYIENIIIGPQSNGGIALNGFSGVLGNEITNEDLGNLIKLINGEELENGALDLTNNSLKRAFDSGMFDINNDGKTDIKDIKMLQRFKSGARGDDLTNPMHNVNGYIDLLKEIGLDPSQDGEISNDDLTPLANNFLDSTRNESRIQRYIDLGLYDFNEDESTDFGDALAVQQYINSRQASAN